MSGTNQNRNTAATNKMLIDATHPEETRVVVLRQGRVEEFDYESAARKLLRGNIYLAKVTRVEPSLQAAFVDYGGNRHGFLAFAEIHPDYYQIPIADRRALIEAEAAAEAEDEEAADRAAEADAKRRQRRRGGRDQQRNRGRQSGASDQRASDDPANEDLEENAYDVSHLLPPEPDAEHEAGDDVVQDAGENPDPGSDYQGADHQTASGDVEQPSDDHATDQPAKRTPDTIAARSEADPTLHQDVETAPAAVDQSTVEQPHNDRQDGVTPEDAKAPSHLERYSPSDADRAPAAGSATDLDALDDDDAPHAIGLVEEQSVTEINNGDDDENNDHDARDRAPDDDTEGDDGENGNGAEAEQVETVADEDALEELPVRPRRRARSYKIQEVIKRRQVILIQVVKEERGTKGAALTTYLSLAGRYTVLMPNTARGGGISRKITNAQDRKRLKEIAADLDVPEGMGLIIRTAGASRTKQEIKRDYDYLLRLWESVRELAINSNAPALVYEEGNLIKRSIRDLYGKEVDEIVVAGDVAYREAKDFMRMLMPSHAKNVISYADPEPLFSRYQIERQLNAMFSPYVHLRSGGYLVINQTEALVSIDINSGKSTREFSIEETAVATNLEAADEIARQLKLRDLAGLIVIDFIDMEEKRNNRAVERRIKDALRFDRARIQVGFISHFGLLEMSRQRMRTGVLEGSTTQCAHCQGTGVIRSTESVALGVLRGLEDSLMTGQPSSIAASTTALVALYILNNKRNFIIEMEQRYGITIHILASEKVQGANFTIERLARRDEVPTRRADQGAVSMDSGFEDEETASAPEARQTVAEESSEQGNDGRRKRRRRRRGRRDEAGDEQPSVRARSGGDEAPHDGDDDGDEAPAPIRGRQRSGEGSHPATSAGANDDIEDTDAEGQSEASGRSGDELGEEAPARRGRRRGRRGGRRGQDRERVAEGTDAAASGPGPDLALDDAPDAAFGDAPAARSSQQRAEYDAGSGDANGGAFEAAGESASETNDTPASHLTEVAAHAHAATVSTPPAVSRWDARQAPITGGPPSAETPPVFEHHVEPEIATEPAEPVPSIAAQRARTEPVASEPVLERFVVGREQTPEPANEDSRPAKRGWWQRR